MPWRGCGIDDPAHMGGPTLADSAAHLPRRDRGYPDRLAAASIPLEAAIVGLADAWDAMTTDRPYHRALEASEAEAELRAHRGTQFSPAVVDAFFRVLERSRPLEGSRARPRTRAQVAPST